MKMLNKEPAIAPQSREVYFSSDNSIIQEQFNCDVWMTPVSAATVFMFCNLYKQNHLSFL